MHKARRRSPESLKAYEKVLTIRPKNRGATFNIALCLQKLGRFDEGAERFREVTSLDPDLLAVACDCAEVRQASEDEVQAATGFKVGGVPPFGHGLPVMVDASLLEHDVVYAAGGDGNTLFKVDPRKLVESTKARVVSVA